MESFVTNNLTEREQIELAIRIPGKMGNEKLVEFALRHPELASPKGTSAKRPPFTVGCDEEKITIQDLLSWVATKALLFTDPENRGDVGVTWGQVNKILSKFHDKLVSVVPLIVTVQEKKNHSWFLQMVCGHGKLFAIIYLYEALEQLGNTKYLDLLLNVELKLRVIRPEEVPLYYTLESNSMEHSTKADYTCSKYLPGKSFQDIVSGALVQLNYCPELETKLHRFYTGMATILASHTWMLYTEYIQADDDTVFWAHYPPAKHGAQIIRKMQASEYSLRKATVQKCSAALAKLSTVMLLLPHLAKQTRLNPIQQKLFRTMSATVFSLLYFEGVCGRDRFGKYSAETLALALLENWTLFELSILGRDNKGTSLSKGLSHLSSIEAACQRYTNKKIDVDLAGKTKANQKKTTQKAIEGHLVRFAFSGIVELKELSDN